MDLRSLVASFFLIAALALNVAQLPRASAHTLLPQALVDYMAAHPDATPEDLEAFMADDPGLYDNDAATKALMLEEARNPTETTLWNTAKDFLRLGIDHILSGLDHVLFVLSLVLFFTTLRDILKLVTAFTVAHSITIVLAGTHLLRVGSNIVEPLIAFSIAYVAVTSVFLRRYGFFASNRNKLLSVFGFGLFHGMGFAGLLEEIAIPDGVFLEALVFFNVGIEIGQLCILAVALPSVYFLRNKHWYGTAMKVFAVTISCTALVWMVQRVMGEG
jgi:hydrogenase/urease accessory protein HupE